MQKLVVAMAMALSIIFILYVTYLIYNFFDTYCREDVKGIIYVFILFSMLTGIIYLFLS